MPDKPLVGLSGPRRTKPRTRAMKAAKSAAQIADGRRLNLEKARRVRAKNLRAEKKARKK